MLEISDADILALSDTDLRSLVQRLAVSEIRARGGPISSVTAGGNQDAPDGGLDVRVECSVTLANPDFVPRRITGYQVKKPNMGASAIKKEMRPRGTLRGVIRELADSAGSYVIVSAQGSVADEPLKERRRAIRDALYDIPNSSDLHTDFYDRKRLSDWANQYPGVVAWVRSRVGRSLAGWSSIGDWGGGGEYTPYLFDDNTCMFDGRTIDRRPMTILEGISRLRNYLKNPKQCIRLVGLSGLGKTRLVQALFEEGIGDDPLDAGISIYTDYSGETTPTARDMARDLIARGQRAILIVDNCNPATHTELVHLCSGAVSEVSLLTVEYDVRDDEPEGTEVFRMQSLSTGLVDQWIKQIFPHLSQVDRGKIAELSDGNFRVARAIAGTVGKGETLGKLKSRELFARIFEQRNTPNQDLLRSAGDLALLYSVDGEDVSVGGELARLGVLQDLPARAYYEALVEMRNRGVVQTRGRFRAILPHAIANPLADQALERIPAASFDAFCSGMTPRMRLSASRRIGFLHDSTAAKQIAERWLKRDGPFGDLFEMEGIGIQIVCNIAPVVPELVLEKLAEEIGGLRGRMILNIGYNNRHQWISLVKALAYDDSMFLNSAELLARFVAAEPQGYNNNSARHSFCELFHMYLSGTQARFDLRRAAITNLACSDDPNLRATASVALNSLLECNDFSAMDNFDFGARSRNCGWEPKTYQDIWDWCNSAVYLAVELDEKCEDIRSILASRICSIFKYAACHDSLVAAAQILSRDGPWIEGWTSFRIAMRGMGKGLLGEDREKIATAIDLLKPRDLLSWARVVILTRTRIDSNFAFGVVEHEEVDYQKLKQRAGEMAQDVGRQLAGDADVRSKFLPEVLVHPYRERSFKCGEGLAELKGDIAALWRELTALYMLSKEESRNADLLGGFLREAGNQDRSFVTSVLESAVDDDGEMVQLLPYFQICVGLDGVGINRLKRSIENGIVRASSFACVSDFSIKTVSSESMISLINDVSSLTNGVEVALDIAHTYLYGEDEQVVMQEGLAGMVMGLLVRIDFGGIDRLHVDHGVGDLIRLYLSGVEGQAVAVAMCANIRKAANEIYISSREMSNTVEALFEVQPAVSLSGFLLPSAILDRLLLFGGRFDRLPVENVDASVLREWADEDPEVRYPLLGKSLRMFPEKDGGGDYGISPFYLSMLRSVPDKVAFLGGYWSQISPSSFFGSFAEALLQRKASLLRLGDDSDEEIRSWVAGILPDLDAMIEHERTREKAGEESFE